MHSKKQLQHINNEKHILSLWKSDDFCCSVKDSFQDSNYFYILMDYLSGGELIKQIRKSIYMPEETARFYLAEIVLAVE